MDDRGDRDDIQPQTGRLKIGYLVPEFPGQTHIFFWREIKRLEEMGVEVQIVSTRHPPAGIRCHSWSDEAEHRTIYLIKAGRVHAAADIFLAAICSISTRWITCFRSIARSDVSFTERARLLAIAFVGAKLSRIAIDGDWDHMHVHSCADAATVTAFASFLSHIPYSLTLHGALADYGPNQAEKWGNAAFGIVVTRRLWAEVEQQLGSDIAAKTLIAPMGVNLETFKRDLPYKAWDGRGAARLYSIGRLNPGKGHDDLIRAIGILQRSGVNVHLTIAGEDESGGYGYRHCLQRIIDELNLQGEVELIGSVPEDRIRSGLLASHLFVLGSHHEALGVAIMEAMALEMPVVATATGGVAELVDHETNGLLVMPGSPDELANAIARVLRDISLAKRLAAASREKIRTHFQDARSARALINRVQSHQKHLTTESGRR